MSESGYYPMGAEHDPSAPWNQRNPEEKEFDMTVSQTLSKNTKVLSSDYTEESEVEFDDEGHRTGYSWYDTENIDWAKEYHANEHYTPIQLIGHLKTFLTEQLKQGIVYKSPAFTEHLIEECEGWVEDECEYVEG